MLLLLRQDAAQPGPLWRGEDAEEKSEGWRAGCAPVRYDREHTLFFPDPPYWQTEGYGVPFGLEHYEQLAARMAALRGRAVLTINDHPEMRRVFVAFQRRRVGISYTIGGALHPKACSELIFDSGHIGGGARR